MPDEKKVIIQTIVYDGRTYIPLGDLVKWVLNGAAAMQNDHAKAALIDVALKLSEVDS